MSYEHGTTHYNLPQTVGSDKRDWADTNAAFALIDTAIYQAGTDAAAASSAASQAQTTANSAATAAAEAQTDADNAQTAAGTAGELAQTAKSRADNAYTLAQSKAGKEVELASVTATSSDTYATLMERIRSTVWANREENLMLYEVTSAAARAHVKTAVSTSDNSVIFTATQMSSSAMTTFEYVFRAVNTLLTATAPSGSYPVITNASSNSAAGITLTLVKLPK